MLDDGAYINGSDGSFTALTMSVLASKFDMDMVRLLLDRGAALEGKTAIGNTALNIAAHSGRMEAVQVLIEKGAALDVVNDHGFSAQQLAEKNGHTDVVQLLKETMDSRRNAVTAKAKAVATAEEETRRGDVERKQEWFKRRMPRVTIAAGPRP